MKFIITIIVIYLVVVLGRFLLRRWLLGKQRQFVEQMGRQFGQQGGYANQNSSKGQPRKKEGEVRVESTLAAQKKVSRSVGDYVEYEEVAEIEYEETK